MSSLAAARADNYYYPPDWTPDKGGINKFQGSHALGQRARKIKQGILVVRFEMMYNCWCEKCENHIGKGVRYNAEKKRVGQYFSTPIWEFRMRCHLCSNELVIRTNPKDADYDFVSGVRKKVETFTAADNETMALADEETKQKLATDPLFRLEHEGEDKRRAEARAPALQRLMDVQERSHRDDYAANQLLRRAMRAARKDIRRRECESEQRGLGITLLPESTEDAAAAAEVRFAPRASDAVRDAKRRRLELRASSVFGARSEKHEQRVGMVRARHAARVDLKSVRMGGGGGGGGAAWDIFGAAGQGGGSSSSSSSSSVGAVHVRRKGAT